VWAERELRRQEREKAKRKPDLDNDPE